MMMQDVIQQTFLGTCFVQCTMANNADVYSTETCNQQYIYLFVVDLSTVGVFRGVQLVLVGVRRLLDPESKTEMSLKRSFSRCSATEKECRITSPENAFFLRFVSLKS